MKSAVDFSTANFWNFQHRQRIRVYTILCDSNSIYYYVFFFFVAIFLSFLRIECARTPSLHSRLVFDKRRVQHEIYRLYLYRKKNICYIIFTLLPLDKIIITKNKIEFEIEFFSTYIYIWRMRDQPLPTPAARRNSICPYTPCQ